MSLGGIKWWALDKGLSRSWEKSWQHARSKSACKEKPVVALFTSTPRTKRNTGQCFWSCDVSFFHVYWILLPTGKLLYVGYIGYIWTIIRLDNTGFSTSRSHPSSMLCGKSWRSVCHKNWWYQPSSNIFSKKKLRWKKKYTVYVYIYIYIPLILRCFQKKIKFKKFPPANPRVLFIQKLSIPLWVPFHLIGKKNTTSPPRPRPKSTTFRGHPRRATNRSPSCSSRGRRLGSKVHHARRRPRHQEPPGRKRPEAKNGFILVV